MIMNVVECSNVLTWGIKKAPVLRRELSVCYSYLSESIWFVTVKESIDGIDVSFVVATYSVTAVVS